MMLENAEKNENTLQRSRQKPKATVYLDPPSAHKMEALKFLQGLVIQRVITMMDQAVPMHRLQDLSEITRAKVKVETHHFLALKHLEHKPVGFWLDIYIYIILYLSICLSITYGKIYGILKAVNCSNITVGRHHLHGGQNDLQSFYENQVELPG